MHQWLRLRYEHYLHVSAAHNISTAHEHTGKRRHLYLLRARRKLGRRFFGNRRYICTSF